MYLKMSYCQKLLNKDYVISLNSLGLRVYLLRQTVSIIGSLNVFISLKVILYNCHDLRKAYCNYRCLNHRLPIEKDRFWGVKRNDRICDLCDLEHIGDEFHYLFQCKYFERGNNYYQI